MAPAFRRALAAVTAPLLVALTLVSVATALVVSSATPASAATPFNEIQFYDYCKAQLPLIVPKWCSGPGLYKVSYPLTSTSVPASVLPGAGPQSQWSANGQEMVFQYGSFDDAGTAGEFFVNSGVGVMNSSGQTTDILADPNATDATISPDGTEIAYVESGSQLWTMSVTGSNPTELGNSSTVCGQSPYWASASGNPGTNGLIVFEQCDDPTGGEDFLATVNPTLGTSATSVRVPVSLTTNANDFAGGSPSATPDGSTYYFSGVYGGSGGIYSVPATGGTPTAGPQATDVSPGQNSLYGAQLGTNGHLLYYDEYANSGLGAIFVDSASGQMTFGGTNADPNDSQFDPTWAPGGGSPTVQSITPTSGPVGGNSAQQITVEGSGFTGATSVEFVLPGTTPTVEATETPTSVTDTSLQVVEPNLTRGDWGGERQHHRGRRGSYPGGHIGCQYQFRRLHGTTTHSHWGDHHPRRRYRWASGWTCGGRRDCQPHRHGPQRGHVGILPACPGHLVRYCPGHPQRRRHQHLFHGSGRVLGVRCLHRGRRYW